MAGTCWTTLSLASAGEVGRRHVDLGSAALAVEAEGVAADHARTGVVEESPQHGGPGTEPVVVVEYDQRFALAASMPTLRAEGLRRSACGSLNSVRAVEIVEQAQPFTMKSLAARSGPVRSRSFLDHVPTVVRADENRDQWRRTRGSGAVRERDRPVGQWVPR